MNSEKFKKRLQRKWSSTGRVGNFSKQLAIGAGLVALTSGAAAAADQPDVRFDPIILERKNVSKLSAKFILKRACSINLNFVQHRSHSSHSSHSSHYSSTGSGHSSHSSHYSSSPTYTPKTYSTPTYSTPSPVYKSPTASTPSYNPTPGASSPPDSSISKPSVSGKSYNIPSSDMKSSNYPAVNTPNKNEVTTSDENEIYDATEPSPTATPTPTPKSKNRVLPVNTNSSIMETEANSLTNSNIITGGSAQKTVATPVDLTAKPDEAETGFDWRWLGLFGFLGLLGLLPRKNKQQETTTQNNRSNRFGK